MVGRALELALGELERIQVLGSERTRRGEAGFFVGTVGRRGFRAIRLSFAPGAVGEG